MLEMVVTYEKHTDKSPVRKREFERLWEQLIPEWTKHCERLLEGMTLARRKQWTKVLEDQKKVVIRRQLNKEMQDNKIRAVALEALIGLLGDVPAVPSVKVAYNPHENAHVTQLLDGVEEAKEKHAYSAIDFIGFSQALRYAHIPDRQA